MSTDASDVELAAMMAVGNALAFDLLFLRYAASVRRVGLALLGNADSADDLVQETFLRVWRHRARYQATRGPLGAWIFTIARNEAISQLRREARHARQVLAARDLTLVAGQSADSLTQAIAREEGAQVRAAVERLPAEQRTALALSYWGGLSHQEVANRTGSPLGTVKGRVRLGAQRIARLLDPHLPAAPGPAGVGPESCATGAGAASGGPGATT